MHYDAVGGLVIRLCKKPAWGRKFPPLEPPALRYAIIELQFLIP